MTFSRTACVATSAGGGFQTLGTANFLLSLYSIADLEKFMMNDCPQEDYMPMHLITRSCSASSLVRHWSVVSLSLAY